MTKEEELKRIIWGTAFGHAHWYAKNYSVLRDDSEKLRNRARNQAIKAGNDAVAAYEEYIEKGSNLW